MKPMINIVPNKYQTWKFNQVRMGPIMTTLLASPLVRISL